MTQKYKPIKSVVITIVLTSYALTLFMCGVVLFSGQPIQTLFPVFIVFFFFGSIFPILALCSSVTIKNGVMFVTAIPFFSKKVNVSNITHINSLNNYAGMGKGLEIHYKQNEGSHIKRVRIGKGAYGEEQIKQIYNMLLQANPNIK